MKRSSRFALNTFETLHTIKIKANARRTYHWIFG